MAMSVKLVTEIQGARESERNARDGRATVFLNGMIL
jgi:hypothetical protein